MPEIKRITLHPLNEEGQPDPTINLYPKTLKDGIVDRNGNSIEAVDTTTEELIYNKKIVNFFLWDAEEGKGIPIEFHYSVDDFNFIYLNLNKLMINANLDRIGGNTSELRVYPVDNQLNSYLGTSSNPWTYISARHINAGSIGLQAGDKTQIKNSTINGEKISFNTISSGTLARNSTSELTSTKMWFNQTVQSTVSNPFYASYGKLIKYNPVSSEEAGAFEINLPERNGTLALAEDIPETYIKSATYNNNNLTLVNELDNQIIVPVTGTRLYRHELRVLPSYESSLKDIYIISNNGDKITSINELKALYNGCVDAKIISSNRSDIVLSIFLIDNALNILTMVETLSTVNFGWEDTVTLL